MDGWLMNGEIRKSRNDFVDEGDWQINREVIDVGFIDWWKEGWIEWWIDRSLTNTLKKTNYRRRDNRWVTDVGMGVIWQIDGWRLDGWIRWIEGWMKGELVLWTDGKIRAVETGISCKFAKVCFCPSLFPPNRCQMKTIRFVELAQKNVFSCCIQCQKLLPASKAKQQEQVKLLLESLDVTGICTDAAQKKKKKLT